MEKKQYEAFLNTSIENIKKAHDENDFKELLKDKKAGKLKFINADEMWASIDKTIAKYECK